MNVRRRKMITTKQPRREHNFSVKMSRLKSNHRHITSSPFDLHEISVCPETDLSHCGYISDSRYSGVVDCSIRLSICKCSRVIYSRKRIQRTGLHIHHNLCTYQFHYLLRYTLPTRREGHGGGNRGSSSKSTLLGKTVLMAGREPLDRVHHGRLAIEQTYLVFDKVLYGIMATFDAFVFLK